MAGRIGTVLWDMRTAGRWTMGRLARKAGVSKAALSQWESGARQPRVAELEAVLGALGASPEQRALALSTIDAPRAIRRLRGTAANAGLGPPTRAGDLLRAMRQRKGWTQEQVAAKVGVVRNAVARWESGERLPSGEQIQALCFALGAREEEFVVLTRGRFADVAEEEQSSAWDEQAERLDRRLNWHHLIRSEEDGGQTELEYLILAHRAWLLATRDERARPLLARIYAYHAEAMRNQERWSEVAPLARRALSLVPRQERELDSSLRAGIMLAVAAVHDGNRLAPARGLHLLAPFLERSAIPAYTGWILSELAEYMALDGRAEEARQRAEQACQVAQQCENEMEFHVRQVDRSRVLLEAGDPQEALNVMPEFRWTNSYASVRRSLVLAEAHQRLGRLAEGHDWLQNACAAIETHGHDRLRPKADELAQRF
jgi:transcriptional regulator with XRE-family HTH domain